MVPAPMRETTLISMLCFCHQELSSSEKGYSYTEYLNTCCAGNSRIIQFMPVLRKAGSHRPSLRQNLERNGQLASAQSVLKLPVPVVFHKPTPTIPRMDSLQFEILLFVYLLIAMAIQYINIYKANLYVMDYHLVLFIGIVLLRRLGWLLLKETLASEVVHCVLYWSKVALKSFLLLCIAILSVYCLYHVMQNSALEDVLFLCYPFGVYLWTFGFTINPYGHTVLLKLCGHQSSQVIELIATNTSLFHQAVTLQNVPLTALPLHSNSSSSVASKPSPSRSPHPELNGSANGVQQATPTLQNGHTLDSASCDKEGCQTEPCLLTPDSIRYEAECLRTDFNLRMKQILFNSLISAYYVGFIPVKFTQNGWLYYDLWWSVQHILFVWVNTFALLIAILVPPHYIDGLYKCATHLGGWKQYRGQRETPHVWSPLTSWPQGVLVRHSKGVFRALGKQNSAVPGDSHHSRFYFIFRSPLRLINWLVVVQVVAVLYQLYILSRSAYWYQYASVVTMLAFNYYLTYDVLRDRWAVQATLEEHDECSDGVG